MKNATKHAEELRSLFKRLAREHKPEAREAQEPLRALVRGALSFDVSDNKADEAMKAIDREFVDLNELRVATELEVQELIGPRYPQIEKRTKILNIALNNIFEREHTLNLARMKEISRRDARQFLRDIPEMHPFVEAYTMLFAFDGHAFPMDDRLLAFLREEEIVDEQTTLEDAQKFVEHHLKDEECYEFYAALRKAPLDDSGRGGKKKKAKA
jgi:endonuclease III